MTQIVETQQGKVEGVRENGVWVFRGLPYAAPPVGEARFRAPGPAVPWAGVRRADGFGASAPQRPMVLPLPGMGVGEMDEDCLFLNVTTPEPGSGRRPVMVWIHGGGFVIGSGSQSIYDAGPLARRGDVVVVTINYRLGPLGFLYLADLCPEIEGAVGNAGIRDQIAALEWVRDNIGQFGGDPDNVTIFGESAGGMSVGTLLGTPSARGLFRRAIPQSGASHNVHTRETATRVAAAFLDEMGVAPGRAKAALTTCPPDKLLDLQEQTLLKLGTSLGLLAFQPMVDGDLLPERPIDRVAAGNAGSVDLLTGTTRDEWKLFGLLDPGLAKLDDAGLVRRLAPQVGGDEVADRIVAAYRGARPDAPASDLFFAIETDRVFRIPAIRLLETAGRHTANTWCYRFDWASPAMGGALGACHAVELPFVFGALDQEGVASFAGDGPEARRLSEIAMDAWIAFARSGDPSHAGVPGGRWSRYEPGERSTMILGRECSVDLDPGAAERGAWSGLL